MQLEKELERIKLDHRKALKATAARVVLGSSVIRVFKKGTKKKLLDILEIQRQIRQPCKTYNCKEIIDPHSGWPIK